MKDISIILGYGVLDVIAGLFLIIDFLDSKINYVMLGIILFSIFMMIITIYSNKQTKSNITNNMDGN